MPHSSNTVLAEDRSELLLDVQGAAVVTERYAGGTVWSNGHGEITISLEEFRSSLERVDHWIAEVESVLDPEPTILALVLVEQSVFRTTGVVARKFSVGEFIAQLTWNRDGSTVLVAKRGPFTVSWSEFVKGVLESHAFITDIDAFELGLVDGQPGAPAAGDTTLVHFGYGKSIKTAIQRYLEIGGNPSNETPHVMIGAGRISGASVSANEITTADYIVSIELDGQVVATGTLETGTKVATIGSLDVPFVDGQTMAVKMGRASGVGNSAFDNVLVAVELTAD